MGQKEQLIRPRVFTIEGEQLVRLNKWKESIKEEYGEYGHYDYIFGGTGIGAVTRVYSYLSKETIDLTEYDLW